MQSLPLVAIYSFVYYQSFSLSISPRHLLSSLTYDILHGILCVCSIVHVACFCCPKLIMPNYISYASGVVD